MSRYVSVVAACFALVASSPLPAAVRLADVTPDGTWDCRDANGGRLGAVVLADTAYAFIRADGRLGGYGKLYRITENFDLPHFAVLGGYLKDEVGALALSMRGPKQNPHDLSGDLFLAIILADQTQHDCIRREAPE